MKVVFFQRKPRPNKNFSIEIFFEQIRHHLPKDVQSTVFLAKYFSNGFFKRLYISLEAIFQQGDINHITGDINFQAIFLQKKKTILTILDIGILEQTNKIQSRIIKYFWLKLPVKRAAYITTISEASKNEIIKCVNIDEKKIRVLYIPVANVIEYSPKAFNKECVTILQIGTKKNKNLLRLIEAIKDIKCKLEIVGVLDGEQLELLNRYKINYVNSVNISNDELNKKYVDADLLAFVSTYEGFGMPIVEAQLVGRPVITSNLLSMPEVAGDGASIVDPYNVEEIKNGILKIINDDSYRESIIKNGLENAKRFDVKKIAYQYAELYREIYAKQNRKI
ncbi:MAG TPA: glycosyltransferase family 1 protein [Vicingaceae bacterium]